MYSNLFSPESIEELTIALQTQFLPAIWETFYVTLLSTAFAIVIGLPLGVLLVVGERDGVLPLPRWLMSVLNVLINLLRSIPFLILMICVTICVMNCCGEILRRGSLLLMNVAYLHFLFML